MGIYLHGSGRSWDSFFFRLVRVWPGSYLPSPIFALLPVSSLESVLLLSLPDVLDRWGRWYSTGGKLRLCSPLSLSFQRFLVPYNDDLDIETRFGVWRGPVSAGPFSTVGDDADRPIRRRRQGVTPEALFSCDLLPWIGRTEGRPGYFLLHSLRQVCSAYRYYCGVFFFLFCFAFFIPFPRLTLV